jgi:hypothetical protein
VRSGVRDFPNTLSVALANCGGGLFRIRKSAHVSALDSIAGLALPNLQRLDRGQAGAPGAWPRGVPIATEAARCERKVNGDPVITAFWLRSLLSPPSIQIWRHLVSLAASAGGISKMEHRKIHGGAVYRSPAPRDPDRGVSALWTPFWVPTGGQPTGTQCCVPRRPEPVQGLGPPVTRWSGESLDGL